MCRLQVTVNGLSVLFDASERSRSAAAWNIWLAIALLGALLVVQFLLRATGFALLLEPLTRMLDVVWNESGPLLQHSRRHVEEVLSHRN